MRSLTASSHTCVPCACVAASFSPVSTGYDIPSTVSSHTSWHIRRAGTVHGTDRHCHMERGMHLASVRDRTTHANRTCVAASFSTVSSDASCDLTVSPTAPSRSSGGRATNAAALPTHTAAAHAARAAILGGVAWPHNNDVLALSIRGQGQADRRRTSPRASRGSESCAASN